MMHRWRRKGGEGESDDRQMQEEGRKNGRRTSGGEGSDALSLERGDDGTDAVVYGRERVLAEPGHEVELPWSSGDVSRTRRWRL